MKKPVYLITLDYPPERGGVARYLGDLVTASGNVIQVIISASADLGGSGNPTRIKMFRQQWPRWWPLVGICHRLKKDAGCLLISHLLPVGTAAMISKWFGGPKFVILCHGLDVRLALASSWRKHLAKWILRFASAIVANSVMTAKEIKKNFGMDATVIMPAVFGRPFPTREDARKRLGIEEGEHVILAVGRLVERKGFSMLLNAAKHLPPSDDIRIVLIGRGPEEAQLVELAKAVPHRVQFVGQVSDEHVNEWYAAADVFCLPIQEDEHDLEGFGIVFLEAALAGLPVVAGCVGGAPEAVVDHQTGLLVDSSQSKDVARALMILLGDKVKQQAFGEAGRKRVLMDFRWEDRWAAFHHIFESIEQGSKETRKQ
jgi:phosphatidyl-myo-inositol dimannoside synthase